MNALYVMPGHLVRRVHQISMALFADECAVYDLTSVQFAALYTIARTPFVDATRLAALIAFDRSTIGDVLERMESKGWIERTPSDTDRRVKLVRLSTAGRQLLARVAPVVERVQERFLAPLPEADRDTFVRLLAMLSDLHNGRSPPSPPPPGTTAAD